MIPVFDKEGPIAERPDNNKKRRRKEWKNQNRSKWARKAQRKRKKERKPSGPAWQQMATSRSTSTTRGKSKANVP